MGEQHPNTKESGYEALALGLSLANSWKQSQKKHVPPRRRVSPEFWYWAMRQIMVYLAERINYWL